MAEYSRMLLLIGGWTSMFTNHCTQSLMATRYWFLKCQQDHHHHAAAATASDLLKIFSFAFMVVLSLLQLKFQNEEDPFQSHPKTMHVAVISLLIYCFLYGMRQRFWSHRLYRASAPLVARAIVFFAFLSLFSIASLLFPDSIRGAFYFLCILLSLGDWPHSHFLKIKNRWLSHENRRLPV